MAYESLYDMVYAELVEDIDMFSTLEPHQKEYVAKELVKSLLEADINKPLSFEEAGEQLDRLKKEALAL